MNTLFTILSSEHNKYYTWYKLICQRATRRVLPKDLYSEVHHILPRSLYPEYANDQNNLVRLTAREHFICHWLLTKIINDPKTVYAFQMMIPDPTGNRYMPKSSIVYQNLKIKFSINQQRPKNRSWYTNGVLNKLVKHSSSPPVGFTPGRTFSQAHKDSLKGISKTEEQKQKQSQSMKGKSGLLGEKNPATRPEVKAKISQSRKGSRASEETKGKMRASKLGKKRGPTSEETKLKISLAKTKSTIRV